MGLGWGAKGKESAREVSPWAAGSGGVGTAFALKEELSLWVQAASVPVT